MTTRPGYIWSGTEWVSIGQEAVVAPVSYQASAPSSPSTGDIWIDSNDDVPGIDTSQFLRWRKTAAGGETSVSGLDDNGLTLQYTANYEQVYLNGVLLVRGQDYTATNGTSITGLTALAANDVVEVFGVVARVVGDVYTQAQTNSLLDAKSNVSSTGLVLISSTDFTSAANVQVNNCFTSTYTHYQVEIIITSSAANSYYYWMQECSGGTAATTSYNSQRSLFQGTVSQNVVTGGSAGEIAYVNEAATGGSIISLKVMNPYSSTVKTGYSSMYVINRGSSPWAVQGITGGMRSASANSIDGIKIGTGSTVNGTDSSMTGTIKVYGYK